MFPARRDDDAGPLRSVLSRLVDPADDWARQGDGRRPSALTIWMSILLGVLFLVALAAVGLAFQMSDTAWLLGASLGLLVLAGAIVAMLMYQVRRHLLHPLAQLHGWALRMCDGDLSARIVPSGRGEFAKLTFHINRLSEALEKLANEMDDVVWHQTERLHQKNQSLELLYEVAASINASEDLQLLLSQSAEKLTGLIGATAAQVHVRRDDGTLDLVSRLGPESGDDALPSTSPTPGTVQAHMEAWVRRQSGSRGVEFDELTMDGTSRWLVSLPLRYQGRDLGMMSFLTSSREVPEDGELHKLLVSVSKHLGMAVAKARLDEESRNLTLMRERASLAHELHDSLAQTLAGLRFQVKMLAETLNREKAAMVRHEVARIESSVDGVNRELRELIANFRAPMDERGLLPALEDLVIRFRRESGIATYFHTECPKLRLSAAAEIQVLGIVREALNNIRKHASARTARILLRCEGGETYSLLVEDDGVGVGSGDGSGTRPGERVGLDIMHERASRLGGSLRIESEPGEGTRIELSFAVEGDLEPEGIRASGSG